MLWTSRVGERRSIPTFFFLSFLSSSFFLAAAVKFVSLSRGLEKEEFLTTKRRRAEAAAFTRFFSLPNERKRLTD